MLQSTYRYHVARTVIPRTDDTSIEIRKLGERQADLNDSGAQGYELVSTITLDTLDVVTIVDTFKREELTEPTV